MSSVRSDMPSGSPSSSRVPIAAAFVRSFALNAKDIDLAEEGLAAAYLLTVAQTAKFTDPERRLSQGFKAAVAAVAEEIADHCPALCRAYKRFSQGVTPSELDRFWMQLVELDRRGELESNSLLADLYLDLKKRAGSRPSQHDGSLSKIKGAEYLRRTQFFSEPYMARFLAKASLTYTESSLGARLPAVIDPACGASSMLVAAFEVMLGRYLSSGWTEDDIFECLIGYDLDPVVAAVGVGALTVAFIERKGRFPRTRARVLAHDSATASLGFFDDSIAAQLRDMAEGRYPIVITNPPFLGRRLMGDRLRTYINETYPEARGDLCTAFMLRCADFLGERGALAVVHQSTLWHLSSLSHARERVLGSMDLQISTNLGSGSFRHLTGEKASVSLSAFLASDSACERKSNTLEGSSNKFLNFSHLTLSEKVERLCTLSENLSADRDYDERSQCLVRLIGRAEENSTSSSAASYSHWAVPMQGTSTGNSREAVRYTWEVPPDTPGWVSVSKGGGYCRWVGLNRYVVLWGKSGELLRIFPGHALRNVDVIDQTALVFSDTGTQGLNVRLRRPEQVFIASGPGIRVTSGDALAHLAFLNSRVATAVLREINPKLTIAAGYIKKLPFSDLLANHKVNAELAAECVSTKERMLARKLTNDECDLSSLPSVITSFDAYFEQTVTQDVQDELRKLSAEAEIDDNVLEAFDLPAARKQAVIARLLMPTGGGMLEPPAPEVLDRELARILGQNCDLRPRALRRGMGGADGPVEALAKISAVPAADIAESIIENCHSLEQVKRAYLDDLLHKLVLRAVGFMSNRDWAPSKTSISALRHDLEEQLPECLQWQRLSSGAPSLESWIYRVLPALHDQVFLGRPVLRVKSGELSLYRVEPRIAA